MSKVDGSSQQSSSGTRSSISRLEQDNSPLLHDKRDRPTDKEKVNLKAINKYVWHLTAYSPRFLFWDPFLFNDIVMWSFLLGNMSLVCVIEDSASSLSVCLLGFLVC